MTMKVDVNVTSVYRWLKNSTARINILRGGTRSSKTYSLAQHIIFNKLITGNDRVIIIAMKTLPALKKTAMKLVLDLLDEYIGHNNYTFNKTDRELRYRNNLLYFMSLDEPHKAASLDYNDLWLEEAVDFTYEDFKQFNMRSSRKGDNNQLFLSFNPTSALSWIKVELIDKQTTGLAEHISTYKDNIKNLRPEIIQVIEDLINQDQNFYKIYALGQWGVLENIIYGNWKTYDELPEKIDYVTYSCDWGFNHPSVITEINWIDGKFIARELFYGGGRTQAQLVEEAKKVIPEEFRQREMYIDSAEPGLILAFYQEGFNSHLSKKDVLDGISYVKTHFLGVTKDSVNGIKELQSYSWKKDKNDNVIDTPVDFHTDFCDTIRYGSFSHDRGGMGESENLDFSLR